MLSSFFQGTSELLIRLLGLREIQYTFTNNYNYQNNFFFYGQMVKQANKCGDQGNGAKVFNSP